MKLQVVQKDNKYYGKLTDTGWIDISSRVKTNYGFAVRPNYPPQVRKIGNIVYLRGEIYLKTSNTGGGNPIIIDLPSEFQSSRQVTGSGVTYNYVPYTIWVAAANIFLHSQDLTPTGDWQGYSLSVIPSYVAE